VTASERRNVVPMDGMAGTGVVARRRREWVPRWFPYLSDAALAALLTLLGVVGALFRPPTHHQLVLAVLALFETVPLAWRRTHPLIVLAIVVVSSSVAAFFGATRAEAISLLIALYSVAAHTERRIAIRAGLAALIVLFLPLSLNSDHGFVVGAFQIGSLALGWMFGAYLGELRGRAARVRHEQEIEKRRAIAEEQARIARELHDVMAHSMSVMVVQAAAAKDVFDTNPDQARESLRSIESTGRQALAEIRRVLDVVRPVDGSAADRSPQPGLSRVGELIDTVRAAGLSVVVRTVGAPFALPTGIDLSAYRIVQEALTNTLKHAEARTATVVLTYEPEQFVVGVSDDGRGGGTDRSSNDGLGQGLIGMRERVALYGGELVAGPSTGGGFQVRARFPLADAR
jgi:signal transduction histidine kinase